jgi:hypothetical protein
LGRSFQNDLGFSKDSTKAFFGEEGRNKITGHLQPYNKKSNSLSGSLELGTPLNPSDVFVIGKDVNQRILSCCTLLKEVTLE